MYNNKSSNELICILRKMKIKSFINYNPRLIANCLTIYRALIGLPLIILLSNNLLVISWIIIFISAISDFLDGYFARKAADSSTFGALLDPLADKLLICSPLIWLAYNQLLPIWAIWLLISRELLATGWRSTANKGGPASYQGKIKTILQFLFILLIMWPDSFGGNSLAINMHVVGYFLFWPCLIIAYSSLINYLTVQSISNHN
tara:strand:- start:988 stop:1599 length:612 start_codon:yes stop_codon:yes gene_type:complete